MIVTYEALVQILVSALTLGGIYAISAIGLALLWGVMGMLNLAHGTIMAIGAYASVMAVSELGFPWYTGLPVALVVGLAFGYLLYHAAVRWMLSAENYETNVVVMTVGLAIFLKSLIIIFFTANPQRQPFKLEGGISLGDVFLPFQTLSIAGIALAIVVALSWMLNRTMMGRAIRATAQDRRAASLMGIPASRIYMQVLMIACVLAAISGVLVSSVENVSPTTGEVAILKVFIICVIAGLGNIPGTIIMSFAMAAFEVSVQYIFSAKWGYPLMISAALVILIYKPAGVFGAEKTVRS